MYINFKIAYNNYIKSVTNFRVQYKFINFEIK